MDKDEKKEFFLSVYRHSLAHVMAKAVMEIFGKENVQITIGPQIADGAYYDFELPRTVTQDDFKTIEDKMREIIKRREDWTRKEVSKEEALEIVKTERRLELAMESERFFDLVRWGDAASVLTRYATKEKERVAYLSEAQFTADRDEYLPIPHEQIAASNGHYKQNNKWGE